MSNHASKMAREARKSFRASARHVKNTAQEEAGNLLHTMQNMGAHATDAVKDGFSNLRDTAGDYVDEGRAKLRSVERSVEKQVKRRPLMSVLMAIGFGFLAGFFCARR